MPDKFPIQLGAYTLLQEIGRGGFATVHLARDEQHGRDVAVKVMDDKLARDPAFIQRFEQEFQLTARLDHPHIIQMLDRGEAQGKYFLVMALVRGQDLRARIRDTGALAVPVALRFAAQIASALDYAHARNIVHRDIKAANILLDESGSALLGDFGLMRAAEGSAFLTTFSQSSGFLGTVEYISPEQARGEPATTRSDLYSFGVVVFEMLTGVVPFRADTPLAVVRAHADTPPPNPLDLRADLPPALASEILRALDKRPEARPKNGTAFINALEAALSAEQQATAAQTARIIQNRQTAVALARARIEEAKRQREDAERAARMAQAQAAQFDKEAAETETLLKELKAEEDQARQAALDAEKARRDAEQKLKTAQTRLARADQSLERFQGGGNAPPLGDEIVVELAQGVELVLRRVPAGAFAMGAGRNEPGAEGREMPQHTVHVDEYYMGKYPVTVLQFWTFVKATQSNTTVAGDVKQTGNHPITNVSWDDAVAFCKWATQVTGMEVRLPTEAQWEKAARGTDGRMYPWGNDAPDANLCNFGNTVGTTTPGGKYSPRGDSPYGCVDMAGNVWEWCADWFEETYYQETPAENPGGPASGLYRVLRGGAFDLNVSLVRCACRGWDHPLIRYGHLGFRVCALPSTSGV